MGVWIRAEAVGMERKAQRAGLFCGEPTKLWELLEVMVEGVATAAVTQRFLVWVTERMIV